MNGITLVKKHGRSPKFSVDAGRNRLITCIYNLRKGIFNIKIKGGSGQCIGDPHCIVLRLTLLR